MKEELDLVECLRKEIKETGRQLAIIFSKEETKLYELKKGESIKITITKIRKK